MSSLQPTSRYLTFSNNNNRSIPQQDIISPSLSGSETDVSTSTENLSHEERFVIRNTTRQEPQGQETKDISNRSSLDTSSTSYNTLIIHTPTNDDSWSGNRISGIRDYVDTGTEVTSKTDARPSSPFDHITLKNRLYDPSVREITDIPDDYLNQSQVLKHLAKEVKEVPSEESANNSEGTLYTNSRLPLIPCELTVKPTPSYDSVQISNIPSIDKTIISRSHPNLSRLEISSQPHVYSPRPKTSGRENVEQEQVEIYPTSDMIELLVQENNALKLALEASRQKVFKSQQLEEEIGKVHRAHEELVESSDRRERLERTARMRLQGECHRLQEHNRVLRDQVELLSTQLLNIRTTQSELMPDTSAATAVATENLRKELSKRELLIAQLITQNKELVAAKERQEIELAAQRATLHEQRTHIDILDTALTNAQGNVIRLEEECRKKQVYVERVAQLQRALSSLQLASDRREQSERKLRLQLERELRQERAKGNNDEEGSSHSGNGGSQGGGQQEESAADLKRQLREREENIMRLEGDVAKWEQRYLEESALRQAAIDVASIPKDAKIAALEKTSQETEKLIAEARSEKIRHMDEVHAAQKKVADLESKVKDLESRLAERDAMIRVLQKHTYEKDVVTAAPYPSLLGRSPHHTPHPSLHSSSRTDLASNLDAVLSSSVSRPQIDPVSTTSVFSTGSSVLTSSCNSYGGSCEPSTVFHSVSATRTNYGSVIVGSSKQSFDETNKSLDDQLKELDSQLDSQLLSKRGLCCFPGFSNSSTSPRKGKISKPLLASVGSASTHHHLFEPGFLQGLVPNRFDQDRPEEIMLLEKQGRSSQQQRMQESPVSDSSGGQTQSVSRSGSLPPSSLPRPHRKTLVKRERRLGEYGRLSDGEGRKTPASLSRLSDSSAGKNITPTTTPSNLSSKSDDVTSYSRLSTDNIQDKSSTCEMSETIGGSSDSNNGNHSATRSQIPTPRKLGEYGRLIDSGRVRNPTTTALNSSQTKLRLFPNARSSCRTSSIDSKPESGSQSKTNMSSGKYRIQF